MDPVTSFSFIPGVTLDDTRFTGEEIAAAEALIQQTLQDRSPTIDLSKNSTLYDVLVRRAAVPMLLGYAMNNLLHETQSLLGALQNPSLANSAVIDEILSNVLITRRAGSKAKGKIKVNVTQDSTYSIGPDVIFTTISGQQYVPTGSFRALSSPTDSEHLQLYATDSTRTQFYFIVPVEAVATGVAGRLVDGVEVAPTGIIPFFISSFAFGNFQSGEDDETNEDLIRRIPEGQSAKNQVSRTSISAVLKDSFPQSVQSVAVQGMNDRAMTRNVNLFNFKTGGYVDIYVRTSAALRYGSVAKNALLIDIGDDKSATYSVQLNRDDFPGHYFVKSVRPFDAQVIGTYTILTETKTFNNQVIDPVTGLASEPNRISSFQEAAYSRYQLNEVLFRIEFDETLGTNPEDQYPENLMVDVEVAYMPQVAEIQDFVNNRRTGVITADYLVRAVIPCFVEFDPIQVEGDPAIEVDDIRQAVFLHVNSLRPDQQEKLRMDSVVSLIRSLPGVKGVGLPLSATGLIYAPDGSVMKIRSNNILEIPQRPKQQVIPETVAYFTELSSIPVSLITT